MLNFDKLRKVTSEMKVEAFTYAENFLQKVFDSLEFDKELAIFDEHEFEPEYFPADVDVHSIFDSISFIIEYNCFGQLRIIFDSECSADNSAEYLILEEVLLKNGFVKVKSDSKDQGTTFFRSII